MGRIRPSPHGTQELSSRESHQGRRRRHGCDAAGLVTEWPEYRDMDWARVISLMRGGVVVDGRNCLEGEAIVAQGGVYLSMGRHATAAPSLLPQTEQPTVAPSIALG